MSMENLGNLGELIGGIAVIISFVFLALQIRQNTRAIRAQSARDSELGYANLNRDMAANPELTALLMGFIEEGAKLEDFTAVERFRYHMHTRGLMQMLQTDYYLYLEGGLPDYVWTRRVKWFRSFIEFPIPKALFEEDVAQMNFDQRFVDALLDEEITVNVRFGETAVD